MGRRRRGSTAAATPETCRRGRLRRTTAARASVKCLAAVSQLAEDLSRRTAALCMVPGIITRQTAERNERRAERGRGWGKVYSRSVASNLRLSWPGGRLSTGDADWSGGPGCSEALVVGEARRDGCCHAHGSRRGALALGC